MAGSTAVGVHDKAVTYQGILTMRILPWYNEKACLFWGGRSVIEESSYGGMALLFGAAKTALRNDGKRRHEPQH